MPFVGLSACGGGTAAPNPPAPAAVASVAVSPSAQSLVPGTTVQLSATARDAQGNQLNDRTLVWNSSDLGIATVSTGGLVTALAPGSARITAAVGEVAGEAAITVTLAPVASLTLRPDTATLVPDYMVHLHAFARDAQGNVLCCRKASWSSSATTIATVSPFGGILLGSAGAKGVAVGTATITATLEGKSAQVTITVRDGGFIPSAGGSFSAAGGNVTLRAPANENVAVIFVDPAVSPPADPKLIPGTAYDFGPSGTYFRSPVTLSVKYDPARLPAGANPALFRLYQLNATTWTPLTGNTVDVSTHTVTAQTGYLSTFAVREIQP